MVLFHIAAIGWISSSSNLVVVIVVVVAAAAAAAYVELHLV